MNRFRTLQWQLTAAYTMVSTILIFIIFFGGGYGILFYQTLSGSLGEQISRELQNALRPIANLPLDTTEEQLLDALFEEMLIHCESPPRSNGSSTIKNLTKLTPTDTCPSSHDVYVAIRERELSFNSYQDAKSVIIWFPDSETVVVDRQGLRTETVSFSERQQDFVERAMKGANLHHLDGLNTVVFAPVALLNSATNIEETAAIVIVEVGINANSVLPSGDNWGAFAIPAGVLLGFTAVIGLIGSYWVTRGVSRRITTLGHLSEEWATGNFTAVSKDNTLDEIGQLGQRLNVMVEQLQNLLEARAELTAVEERNRIARELHDAAKQQIFATDMQLYTAENLIDQDVSKAKNHIQEARRLTKSIQSELSTLIDQLRPAQLDGKGLFEAVRETAVQFQERNQIEVDIRLSGEQELPLEIEQPLFRILQEALSNIARHSQASQVVVHLVAEKDKITLTIRDNGIGFEQEKIKQGIGLASMQERIKPLSGELIINSNPTQGTTIKANIPINQ